MDQRNSGMDQSSGSPVLMDESLSEFLGTVEMLSAFDGAELAQLAAAAESRFYNFGETICTAGEICDGLYIIKKGAVRIFSVENGKGENDKGKNGKETSIGVRKVGEVFAELAVLRLVVRREVRHELSVRSSAKSELLFIPHVAFEPLLKANEHARAFISSYVAISSVGGIVTQLFDLRGKVEKKEIEQFIGSVGIKRLPAGHTILQQDSREDRRLYVVRQGEVKIVRTEEGSEYPIAKLKKGEIFGEKACLLSRHSHGQQSHAQEQPASAIAMTDVVLLVIPEQTIHFILERNAKLLEVLEERIQFAERELQRQKKVAEQRRRPTLLDLTSKEKRGERVIKRFPLVEQAEEMDCGAACLAMICKHYEIPLTLGKLREMANVTTQGATMESLARVGESLGFTMRGVQCSYDSLPGFELPFIVHWEGYHYIVVYGISKQHVWVADPGPGFKKMTLEEFERGWNGTCLLFNPGADRIQLAASKSPWVRFVGYLKPYKQILIHLALATFIIQILGVAPPLIIQNILDRVIVHQNVPLLHLLIVGLVITNLFSHLTGLLRSFLSAFMVRNMDFIMMSHFFKHAMSLPLSFFAKRKTGDIFARFQENQTIRAFLTESTISTVLNLLMVFIYFTIMFLYNVTLTLLLIAFVIPIILLTVAVTPKLKHYARETFAASTDAEAALMETLGGVETIKGMGIERLMRIKWEKKYIKAVGVQYNAQKFGIWLRLVTQLLNSATTIVILWVGASLVLSQALTIGQLIAFNALMGSALAPLMGLVALWNQVHAAGVAMERLGDVLDMEPEQKPEDLASRLMLPELQGHIVLEGVFFRYGESETPYVLKNIDLTINPGEVVAIVGQSGSGKTTLAKLLVGFYPPTEGKISIDGYDLALIDKEYYRAQVGYVMQSNLLFSGTIAENIAAGDENPDRRHIVAVAKTADAHDFISATPLGYEQVVGERGMGLSGGQVQRICIARALYHDPRLLIFDEATSALDTQSESNILQNMQNILEGRTAVVIAHRLSTVMQADKIVVLYDGSIVEQGSHQALFDRKGMYYQLVQKQMPGAQA